MQDVFWNIVIRKRWVKWIVEVRVFVLLCPVEEVRVLEKINAFTSQLSHDLIDPVASFVRGISELIFEDIVVED
jgi:hypothetical protein